jgi:hypothetical protein
MTGNFFTYKSSLFASLMQIHLPKYALVVYFVKLCFTPKVLPLETARYFSKKGIKNFDLYFKGCPIFLQLLTMNFYKRLQIWRVSNILAMRK